MRQISHCLNTEKQLREAQVKLEALNSELEKMAWIDGFTGLANRRRFDVALNEEFYRAMRKEEPIGLILMDVDHFKQFNDHYGHLEGDKCLQQIAKAIMASVTRTGELSARYGGEEVAILLPNTDLTGVLAVTERLMSAIRDLAVPYKDLPIRIVTVSCGVHAFVPRRGQHIPADLVQAADAALYSAKAAGRDQTVCATDLPKDRSAVAWRGRALRLDYSHQHFLGAA